MVVALQVQELETVTEVQVVVKITQVHLPEVKVFKLHRLQFLLIVKHMALEIMVELHHIVVLLTHQVVVEALVVMDKMVKAVTKVVLVVQVKICQVYSDQA